MQFRNHRLKNGLEIVAECNDQAHSLAVGFFVRTGARDENDSITGVSHFLEHMAFKGTPLRSADDVNRAFDEMGAHHNAFTSEESTVYFAAILPEMQPASVELLADLMRPSLRKEDFDTEKEVIIEEIRMYEDQPPYRADDILKARYFKEHPLSRSVLGTVASIQGLSVGQMQDYFADRYGPDNIFVAAAGRVDFDRLIEQVTGLCDHWPAVHARRETPPAPAHRGFESIHRASSSQQYILQMAAAPASADKDRFAAKLVATILGDDSGSRMYWDLVDSGIAEQASLGHSEYQGAGLFYAWSCCAPDRANSVLASIHAIYQAAEESGITQQELAQAKSKVKARVVLGSERPRNRLFSVGGNWLSCREYRSVADDLQDIENVTLDEVHELLAKYPLSINTTLTIGPSRDIRPVPSTAQIA
ncbi:MAG: insulinase family protein [Pirellulales bacterium]|nr:insulinase family protein [Pirellulales bacterium]